MRAKDLLYEFYDPADDRIGKLLMSDTRRPRITLRHLNKLKVMREIQLEDEIARNALVKKMYSQSESDDF